MWITPQDEALQAQSAAIIALLISLFGLIRKRNRLRLSFLCLSATRCSSPRSWWLISGPNTTLADLFTLRARVEPFSAVWASLRWRSGDERNDGCQLKKPLRAPGAEGYGLIKLPHILLSSSEGRGITAMCS